MAKVKSVKLVNQYVSAPLWRRFFAYIIDLVVVNIIVTIPFRGYLSKFSNNLNLLFGSNDRGLTYITVLIVLTLIFYFAVLEYKIRQTLGKIIMNIYVISLSNKEISFSQILLRNLTKPFPIVLLVDVSYMFFKGGNQRLFDVFSRTAVVEKGFVVK